MSATLARGFAEPVVDAAHTFRALLTAMSRPGTITRAAAAHAPACLSPAMAAVLMTLCDADTPLHLADALDTADSRAFVAFHTGAPLTAPQNAHFVFTDTLPPLAALSQGTDHYPDHSATVCVEVAALSSGGARLAGPGIDGEAQLQCPLFTEAFAQDWAINGRRFPRGVDLILTCGEELACLPRTTRLSP